MIDFASRVEALTDFLLVNFGIADSQAVEILISSFMQLPGQSPIHPPPRIILETEWRGLVSAAWFDFGGVLRPETMVTLRVRGPRWANKTLVEWMQLSAEFRSPMVVVEPEYKTPVVWPKHPSIRELPEFIRSSIRLRVKHPKDGRVGLRAVFKWNEQAAAKGRLKQLALQCVDSTFRIDPGSIVPNGNWNPPAGFLYYCELLEKLLPVSPGWENLVSGVVGVALRRARLYDRVGCTPDSSDWAAARRVMRDMAPEYTIRILEALGPEFDLITHTPARVAGGLGMECKVVAGEMARLRRVGVIRYGGRDGGGGRSHRGMVDKGFLELID